MFGLTKHWEVCVEAAPGSSDSVTKLFGKARYFGGPGPSWWKGADDGLSWDADRVAHIEAVELVGETRRSDAEIIEIGRFRWANFPTLAGNADGADRRVAGVQGSGSETSGESIWLRGGTARTIASDLPISRWQAVAADLREAPSSAI